MKKSVVFLLGAVVCFGLNGCGTAKPAVLPGLVDSLQSRNRNTVHVALWTLDKNKFVVSKRIDLQKPYYMSEASLQMLVDRISHLDADELDALEKSLAYHWSIYSPIWGPGRDQWE